MVDYTARALKESLMTGYDEEGNPENVVVALRRLDEGLTEFRNEIRDGLSEASKQLGRIVDALENNE